MKNMYPNTDEIIFDESQIAYVQHLIAQAVSEALKGVQSGGAPELSKDAIERVMRCHSPRHRVTALVNELKAKPAENADAAQ